MEAPEKIFICNYGSELSYEWHSESEFEAKANNDIEYTRTDTFIEKACKFLFENYHGEKLSLKMIENFRKYLKGE